MNAGLGWFAIDELYAEDLSVGKCGCDLDSEISRWWSSPALASQLLVLLFLDGCQSRNSSSNGFRVGGLYTHARGHPWLFGQNAADAESEGEEFEGYHGCESVMVSDKRKEGEEE